MKNIVRILPCLCWLALARPGWSQSPLADASLEDLLKIRVTSVSKKEQPLSRTAASVYVITAEEIRRSSAENLPDLLRMVPGVDVAQIDANAWAITIRGFNSRYASKVLVMIDGRAVYTTTFGGVYWDQIDLPLESIERVEVIRGPGGTVWGANAMNGVINVITRSAAETRGGVVVQSAGNGGAARNLVQYGGAAGPHGDYRAFGSWLRESDMDAVGGGPADDGWTRSHAGFRGDWQTGERDSLMLEGGWFVNRGNQNRRSFFVDLSGATVFNEPVRSDGGNLVARWTRTSSSGAETAVQAYYDGYHRRDMGSTEGSHALDFDVQQHFSAGGRQDLVVAAGYRAVRTESGTGGEILLTPRRRIDQLYSAFLQDEIRLGEGVWLTAGSKFEHNSYTGFEYEPSLRLAWAPGDHHMLWASVARAIRQPARADAGIQLALATIPLGNQTKLAFTLSGNPGIRSEQLRDGEAGYRAQLAGNVSVDVSGFFGHYHGLLTIDDRPRVLQVTQNEVRILMPLMGGNGGSGASYGGEATVGWSPSGRWRLSGGYAYLYMSLHANGAADPLFGLFTDDNAPRHAVEFRSLVNLTRRLEWDQFCAIQSQYSTNAGGHLRVDSRLAWRAGEHLELSINGQNLFRPGYVEFSGDTWIVGSLGQRRITGRVAWNF